jgi:hypothetical protein
MFLITEVSFSIDMNNFFQLTDFCHGAVVSILREMP